MRMRNATAAVIGAGDYIGAAIARKFANEGFIVFAGRRNGDKLAPLAAEVEARAGRLIGRSLDARKENEITSFLRDAESEAPLEVCIFTSAPMFIYRCLRRRSACFARYGKWHAMEDS